MAAPATTSFRPGPNGIIDSANPPRPAARAIRDAAGTLKSYLDSTKRPYIHLVDGGVSDNVGMRGVLDALAVLEALHSEGVPTPLDHVKRIIVFVVNSVSFPPTKWDESEAAPGTVDVLMKSAGAPIDHFSYEAVELLKDIAARWQTTTANPKPCRVFRGEGLGTMRGDTRACRRDLRHRCVVCRAQGQGGVGVPESPTHDVCPARRGGGSPARRGGTIILASPEFKRLLRRCGATIVSDPVPARSQRPPPAR